MLAPCAKHQKRASFTNDAARRKTFVERHLQIISNTNYNIECGVWTRKAKKSIFSCPVPLILARTLATRCFVFRRACRPLPHTYPES